MSTVTEAIQRTERIGASVADVSERVHLLERQVQQFRREWHNSQGWEGRVCVVCEIPLVDKQKKFCSDTCRANQVKMPVPRTNVCGCGAPIIKKAKRCKSCLNAEQVGERGRNYKGDSVSAKTARQRSHRVIDLGMCEFDGCESPAVDRHHIDGNTYNNDPTNLTGLCRLHHMMVDGRLDALHQGTRERYARGRR